MVWSPLIQFSMGSPQANLRPVFVLLLLTCFAPIQVLADSLPGTAQYVIGDELDIPFDDGLLDEAPVLPMYDEDLINLELDPGKAVELDSEKNSQESKDWGKIDPTLLNPFQLYPNPSVLPARPSLQPSVTESSVTIPKEVSDLLHPFFEIPLEDSPSDPYETRSLTDPVGATAVRQEQPNPAPRLDLDIPLFERTPVDKPIERIVNKPVIKPFIKKDLPKPIVEKPKTTVTAQTPMGKPILAKPLSNTPPSTQQNNNLSSTSGDQENSCKTIPKNLRSLFFERFQDFLEARNGNASNQDIEAFSKRLGRVMAVQVSKHHWVGESSGDSANIHVQTSGGNPTHYGNDGNTGSKGVFDVNRAKASLDRWDQMWKWIPANMQNQTVDAGILQLSPDRLYVRHKLGLTQEVFASRFHGDAISGVETSDQLNRKYFSTYQNLAKEEGSAAVIKACKTQTMFDGATSEMASRFEQIKSCQVCDSPDQGCGGQFLDRGTGLYANKENSLRRELSKAGVKGTAQDYEVKIELDKMDRRARAQSYCFVHWVSLCPALNIDIGLSAEDDYYGTKAMDYFEYNSKGEFVKKRPPSNFKSRIDAEIAANPLGRCFETLTELKNQFGRKN